MLASQLRNTNCHSTCRRVRVIIRCDLVVIMRWMPNGSSCGRSEFLVTAGHCLTRLGMEKTRADAENIKLVEATEATAIETSPALKLFSGPHPIPRRTPWLISAAIEFAMTFPVSTFMQQHCGQMIGNNQ